MPHVSKNKLNTNLYNELLAQLVELPVGLSKKQTSKLISSLLTDTEQVMITKRCAAAIMFAEGFSNYRVWTTLQISQSTARRLRLQYDQGEFDGVVEVISNKKLKQKERQEFMNTLEKVLRLGMPEMGSGRWKFLNRHTTNKG